VGLKKWRKMEGHMIEERKDLANLYMEVQARNDERKKERDRG
jgi:hypothetical protein